MHLVRTLLCSCLALLACLPAAAQTGQATRPERPYRGVYASGVDGGQSLTATTSVSAGYDDNLLADATQRNNPFQQGQQGKLAQVSGGLNYSLTSPRGALAAGAGASLRYYPSLENDSIETYNARIDGQWIALTKPQLTLHQSAGYQPFTFLSDLTGAPSGLEPGVEVLVPPNPDFVPVSSQYFSYDSGADLVVRLTSRVSYNAAYGYHIADHSSQNTWRQTGTMGLSFQVTRDLSVRPAYRYNEFHYPTRTTRTHVPEIGLDFDHGLSLTRRTTLGFGIGTEATVVHDQTRYRATGNVNVRHEIGRSWTANGGYSRGTSYSDTLPEPVFADTGQVSLSGLVTRRIQFDASAIASIGKTGFDAQQQHFDSYRGIVTLSTALNRYMNVGVDYSYYRYKFDESIQLEPGQPHHVNRQSVRAHVSFWAPLLNRTRRRDASR